ncbi:hypothetical protein [Lentibacillus juripiscarius]|uniref:Uncharacterized protein n=1 Tax=Lentibacillus juripiscarius TaxID=257446 RepID=A0ABW5V3R2_9BACI
MQQRKLFWLGFLLFAVGGLSLAVIQNEFNSTNIIFFIIAVTGLLLISVPKIRKNKET